MRVPSKRKCFLPVVFGKENEVWFTFDDASAWEKRAIEYRQCYHALAPNGIDPATFQSRGAYGAYYAGQVTVKGGY